ncbi:hypothetical protein VTL71DRAFT_311 [Oculimacula yallundae]|uniref:Velvet domain-containing protein n=1 Tax=Oculimacula yallundae TaxID=86028 RepID=A0ABR4D158_9HELO
MAGRPSTHQFADAKSSQVHGLSSHHCELIVRQGPDVGRVAVGKEKDRKPVDPPPIIQLKVSEQIDKHQNFLQSPYFFMTVSLLPETESSRLPAAAGPTGTSLAGTLVSSLHRLKDSDNGDGAFFIFGDLSVKHEGRFRLQFTLYEMRKEECAFISLAASNPFPVVSAKSFMGMAESTWLTRSFSDQGVRLRIRKEPRTLLRKRGPAHDDYQPRHYTKVNRQSSLGGDRQSMVSSDPQQIQRTGHDYSETTPPWPNRQFAQSSASSFPNPPGSSFDEPQPAKRPRTGSEQGHISTTFGQVQSSPLDTNPLPSRSYSEGYTQYGPSMGSSQLPPYGNYYPQSPQSANPARQHYLPGRTGIADTASPYDSSNSRSPHDTQFPSQSQAVRYNSMNPASFNTPQFPISAQASQHANHAMALAPNPPVYSAPGNYDMPPPSARYPEAPTSGLARRQDFQTYSASGPNPNMSAGNYGAGVYSSG